MQEAFFDSEESLSYKQKSMLDNHFLSEQILA